jgi:hypothetical protein
MNKVKGTVENVSLREDILTEFRKFLDSIPKKSFTNEYGEKFTIYSNGITAYMSGDEVNAMVKPNKVICGVIPLFNQNFDIWSSNELYQLGKALMELNKEEK